MTDPVSFVIGLLFVASGGGLSMAGIEVADSGVRWLGAALLWSLGIVLLAGSKARD